MLEKSLQDTNSGALLLNCVHVTLVVDQRDICMLQIHGLMNEIM
jgi:hypothetical protein